MASLQIRYTKDGQKRFCVKWRDPKTRCQKSHTVDTETAARELMADLERHNHNLAAVVMEREALISAEATIADLITAHLIQLDGVEATTLAKNRAMADRHIIPALGKITARELTRADVVTWINSLPVAPKTAKNIHAVLSSSLNTAVRDGVIMRNVAYGVTPPKARDENNGIEPVFIPRLEVDRLIACTPERLRGLMRVLAYGGLRFGEATALRFSDISVDESGRIQLHVRRAWKNTGKKESMYLGVPKTKQSRRIVTLSVKQSTLLRGELQPGKPGDWLFTLPNGEPVTHWIFRDQYWGRARKDAQIVQSPRIHDLRHSHASALLTSGVPMHVVSRRLGHSSIKTTIDTYGHLQSEDDASAAEAAG